MAEGRRAVAGSMHPLAVLAVLVALGWLAIALLDTVNFTIDDTFISLRYSENLASGHGLVYNPGERVEGISNPLWTVLLAAFARAGWSQARSDLALLEVSKVLGALFAFGTIALLGVLALWIARRRALGRLSALVVLAVLGTVATYSFALWSMSGLETSMCACLLTLALAAHFRALVELGDGVVRRGWLVLGGVAFGVVTWVRPEQPFAWGITMAVFLLLAPPRTRAALVWSVVPTLVLYGALEAFRLSYYHALVPNSVVAKAGGGVVAAILGVKYTLAALGGTIGFVSLGLCGLPELLRGRREWQFIALYCAATALLFLASGGDWMPGYRLFVPLAPMLWLLAIAATLVLLDAAPRVPAAVVAAVVLVFALAQFSEGRKAARAEYPFGTGLKSLTWTSSHERIALAKWLNRRLPPGRVLAVFEAGYVPYFCDSLRIQDDSGLNDRDIARLPGRHMEKLTSDVFLRKRPDYFLAVLLGAASAPPGDLVTLQRDPRFEREYELARRAAPTGGAQTEEHIGWLLYRRRDLAPDSLASR